MDFSKQEKFLVVILITMAAMAGLSFVLPFLNNHPPVISVKNNMASCRR